MPYRDVPRRRKPVRNLERHCTWAFDKVAPYQKKNLSASWTKRGKLYCDSGNCPKVALGKVVFGGLRMGVLVMLKASARNWSL